MNTIESLSVTVERNNEGELKKDSDREAHRSESWYLKLVVSVETDSLFAEEFLIELKFEAIFNEKTNTIHRNFFLFLDLLWSVYPL